MRSSGKELSGEPWVLRSGSALVPLRTAFGVATEDFVGKSPEYRLSVIWGLWGHLQGALQKGEPHHYRAAAVRCAGPLAQAGVPKGSVAAYTRDYWERTHDELQVLCAATMKPTGLFVSLS